ncbi:hypothetical protein SGRA_0098 [Saprospira grandis str. Lewin]|uniref:Uncharacterized protein n=1 Tax=Saprospira grandis (strain Lewin) TaxID=984262 RepID=H6L4G4_SAPGL|nr:hypothetical protein SGRA_0098 [Saprospira grandis str. Lewin]
MEKGGRRPDRAFERSEKAMGRADLRALTQPDPPAGRGSPKKN